MLSKTIELLSTSLVAQKKEAIKKKLGFVLLVWSCFWLNCACSSLLRLVPDCFHFQKRWFHRMFRLANSCQILLQSGATSCVVNQGKWHYKVGQVLQSRAIFITKWEKLYLKVGQVLQSGTLLQNRAVLVSYLSKKRFWPHIKQTHSPIPCLSVCPFAARTVKRNGREQYFLLTNSVIFL